MTSTPLVNLASLIADAKCFDLIRQHRWPEGVRCPRCGSAVVARDGRDDRQLHRQRYRCTASATAAPPALPLHRQRYRCTACNTRFDDLTGTVLAGHHQPLRVGVLCLYFMGLNLSNRQIARELDLCVADVQAMTEHLRTGLTAKIPSVCLVGEVEIDEVYVVAGHKGNPAAVAKKAAPGGGAG